MEDGQTSNFDFVFVPLRKTNYALVPLRKRLINAVGFRNMKRNSEKIKKTQSYKLLFLPHKALRFNAEPFVGGVNPCGLPPGASLETKLTEKVIKGLLKSPVVSPSGFSCKSQIRLHDSRPIRSALPSFIRQTQTIQQILWVFTRWARDVVYLPWSLVSHSSQMVWCPHRGDCMGDQEVLDGAVIYSIYL